MSKTLMIGIVVLVVLLGSKYFSQPDNSKMMEQDSTPKAEVMMATPGSYTPFTPAVLEESRSKRRVLYFYASWCPTCIPANADFEKNTSLLPSDVAIIRVNYNDPDTDDAEKELATKYGVTYQHTFVQIDNDGKEVFKWNGGATKELLANLK